jgi:hypothetical protein
MAGIDTHRDVLQKGRQLEGRLFERVLSDSQRCFSQFGPVRSFSVQIYVLLLPFSRPCCTHVGPGLPQELKRLILRTGSMIDTSVN